MNMLSLSLRISTLTQRTGSLMVHATSSGTPW